MLGAVERPVDNALKCEDLRKSPQHYSNEGGSGHLTVIPVFQGPRSDAGSNPQASRLVGQSDSVSSGSGVRPYLNKHSGK